VAFGPFDSYAPPGAYTKTKVRQDTSGPPTGNRIPVLVGVGRETLAQEDSELVRGSSSSVDQRIVNEDMNDRFILDNSNPDNPILGTKTGAEARFRVQNFPIVAGDGRGQTTTDLNDVTVTVDGDLVSPAAVDGARGVITLQVAPEEGADVRITYFFNRTDTSFTDDVSDQVTDEQAILLSTQVETYEIVSGANVLSLNVDGSDVSITLNTGAARTANNVANDINAAAVVGLTASVDADNQGQNRIQLASDGSLTVLSGTANAALGFAAGQTLNRRRRFFTYQAPIVTGDNGGITTTNPADVTVTVDGTEATVEEVDGTNGSVLLAQAPLVGSEVVVTYFHNTWQNTFDYLPNTGIESVQRVGISPGRTDYIEGNDYVVDSNGRIIWGNAVTVESAQHTAGTEFFDDTQITASLRDDRIFFEAVEKLVERSVSPAQESDTTVVLGNVPTVGNGSNTPLDSALFASLSNDRVSLGTHRADLVLVYHGSNLSEAMAEGPVEVVDVNPVNRQVTVADAIPPDHNVWATYWYNRLADDELTFEVLSQSIPGVAGQYSILSSRLGEQMLGVSFGTTGVSETIQWPSGVESNPDAFLTGASGVNEVVTITFTSEGATPAVYTNFETDPYSLYANASDTLYVNVSSNDLTVDLNQSAFAVIVSDSDADGLYTVATGTNDSFEFEVDGTAYTTTFTAGAGIAGATLAEEIWRTVPTTAVVDGTAQDTANGGADFVIAGSTTYSVELNGTTYTEADTALVGGTYDAAAAASAIETALATASGLTAGDLSVVGNDFNVVANADGTVSIQATDSVTVNTTVNGGDELDTIIGFSPLDTQQVNTKVALYSNNRFLLRSKVEPAGPGDVSEVRTLDGSANDLIGFANFQTATGTEAAVNKPATLLSGAISSADIASLDASSDSFVVAVDGVEYTVPYDGVSVSSVADIATEIDGIISGTAVVEDTDKIRITSSVSTTASRIEVRNGSANQYVGFDNGDAASQRQVTVEEVVAVLNSEAASDWYAPASGTDFIASAFAEAYEVTGEGTYLRLTTFGTGATESFTFSTGADSALNDTGIGIEAGDTAAGTAVMDGFTVSSDRGAEGSAGTGIVGQTYTDDTTGLRFTILEASGGDYTDTQSFTLLVSDTFETGVSNVVRAVPGAEISVSNTTDIGVGDTALVQTYNQSGSEPGIGDFYYITYEYEKTDFTASLFTRFRDIQSNFGTLSAENPLTLASFLTFLNGAAVVGIKQVEKQTGFGQASSQAYLDALQELARPLAGGATPDLLVPLTTDPSVLGAYVRHAEIQSSQRFRQERRCIFGVASGTRPDDAAAIAQGLNSKRAIVVYPDSAIVTLSNELGDEENFIVDGTYIAAALSGVLVSPQFDVATPLTRRRITGFRRLNRSLDEVEKNRLAVAGVTVLEDRGTFLQVRDGLTTNVSNRFTSTPSIVAIEDFVQQQTRATLDRFIGLKFLTSRSQDVEAALSGLLNALVEQQIIVDFQGVRAEPDQTDPTTLRVSAFYAPVFPLKYIPVTYTIGVSGSL